MWLGGHSSWHADSSSVLFVQVASAEENASFQEAEKAVAETMAAAAVAVAEAERQVEAAVETAQATEAATAMTEAKLAQVESQVRPNSTWNR
jgi:hypothetical protein